MKENKKVEWVASYWENNDPKKAKENKQYIISQLEDLLDCVKKQHAGKLNKNFSEMDYYLTGLGYAYNDTIDNEYIQNRKELK